MQVARHESYRPWKRNEEASHTVSAMMKETDFTRERHARG